jgi:hypothetical protein
MKLTDVTSVLGFSSASASDSIRSESTKSSEPSAKETYGERVVEFRWQAPSRKVLNMSPKAVRTLLVMCVAISIVFALMQEFVLILVIGSIGFLAYMLTKSVPEIVVHEINTHGIRFAEETFYYWHQLSSFFFKHLDDSAIILCVDTVEKIPGRLFMNIDSAEQDKLKQLLEKRLLYVEEEPRDYIDKVFTKLVSRLSLDR